MKLEQVGKGISGIGEFIKRNPYIVILGVIILLLFFLFTRPEKPRIEKNFAPQPPTPPEPPEPPVQHKVEVIPVPIPEPPKIVKVPVPTEPPIQPVTAPDTGIMLEKFGQKFGEMMQNISVMFEDVIAHHEATIAQITELVDTIRVDRPDTVHRRAIDFRENPQRYVEEIMREGVIRHPRPRKNGKILVADGRWEPEDKVIERQRRRYEEALARGDYKWAEIVRRETEIALGRTLEW